MQVDLNDLLAEYRDHGKFMTDDLLLHKAAVKNLEKQVAQLQTENANLKAAATPAED